MNKSVNRYLRSNSSEAAYVVHQIETFKSLKCILVEDNKPVCHECSCRKLASLKTLRKVRNKKIQIWAGWLYYLRRDEYSCSECESLLFESE